MEVLLKKTKITKSIFNQMQKAHSKDFHLYKVLGFCLVNEKKWILLYDEKLSTPLKYDFITNIKQGVVKTDKDGYTTIHPHYVSCHSTIDIKLTFKTEEEAKKVYNNLIETMNKASELGQIFL